MAIKKDPTTQSNYQDIATKHIDLKWNVDFKSQTVGGTATLELVAKKDDVKEVVLDIAHLDIKSVQVEGQDTKYELGKLHAVMGSSLAIPLPKAVSTGNSVKVSVKYSTTKDSTALQWLDPAQTAGKKHPYLFSQCQPIHARSLVPLQDSPSVKQTYSASIKSVYPVLLSAIRQTPPSTGPAHDGKEVGVDVVTYTYEQPIPIPSYLIAIAAGNVVYRPFPVSGRSWTSGVWCEPEIVDAAYDEFAEDTVRFLATAEDNIAPYRFGVYDLLVLPPSFPYGGMENACLTFLTPTLLTGDRTLTDVVVHELTHSYFGNGVTQADASSFFLNEGWTTYVERLLQGVLHGQPAKDFSFIIGRKALKDSLESYKDHPKYQRLVIDFEHGEDPDDAYSSIPYEKGANLMLHIERTLGGLNVFLPFIKEYVNTFTGKSISGDEWKDFLYEYYRTHNPEKVKALDTIDWNAWFYGEGTELPVDLEYDITLANQAYNLAAKWDASRNQDIASLKFSPTDLADFNGNQVIVFLERLQSLHPLPASHIHRLGDVYSFNNSGNCEIRQRWYGLALASPAAKDYAKAAAEWLVDAKTGLKGRMKYCRPTFKATFKVNPELTKSTFLAHETEFHPIARQMIKKDLGLAA